jgi:uncharacterized protein
VRPFSAVILAVASLVTLATGGPTVQAESDDGLRFPHLNNVRPAPVVRSARPQQPARVRTAPRNIGASPVYAPGATAVVAEPLIKPKIDPLAFIMVMGDSLAELLAGGIDEAFGDNQDIAIVRKAKADSGLVRADYYDWPKTVTDILASAERVTHGVFLIGANDRQAIREGEISHEPLSPRWRELYLQRIDAIARGFAERRIPLLWVGVPPMRNERLSSDLIVINELFRERVQANRGVYIDLWEPFVDAENRFTLMGPDINGLPMRLRAADGVHFTKAGARKAAFFVDRELRRLIDIRAPASIIALPGGLGSDVNSGGASAYFDLKVPSLPELPGLPSIPAKPPVGAVTLLTRIELAAGGRLVSGRIVPVTSDSAFTESVFVDGRPPEPVEGRSDDFRWPKR